MTAPTLYLWFPGTAAEALRFYQRIFGGELTLLTNTDMGRTDAPAELICHGALSGPVPLYGADAVNGEATVSMEGMSVALVGTADGETLTRWFECLSDGGTVLDPLQVRPWGDVDGQVRDRYGVRWLIGYQTGDRDV